MASSIYTQYPHHKIHTRVRHLNNRDLAILFGVFLGMIIAIYGLETKHFSNIAVFGTAFGRSLIFKFVAILLSAGTFGNLLSYVGAAVDILTNHRTIFDFLAPKFTLPTKQNDPTATLKCK